MADEPLETGLIGGAEKREIKVEDYDPDWPKKFEQHAKRIADALDSATLRRRQIGATAVPRLAPQPIHDILRGVPESGRRSDFPTPMETGGDVPGVPQPDLNRHRKLRTLEKDVHVHVYSVGCPEI